VDLSKVVVKKVRILSVEPAGPMTQYLRKLDSAVAELDKILADTKTKLDPKQLDSHSDAEGGGNSGQAAAVLQEVKPKIDEIVQSIDAAAFKKSLYTETNECTAASYRIPPNQYANYAGSKGALYVTAQQTGKKADEVGKKANIFGKEVNIMMRTVGNAMLKAKGNKNVEDTFSKTGQVYRMISQTYTKIGAGYAAVATECANILGDIDKFMNAITGAARAQQQAAQQQQPQAGQQPAQAQAAPAAAPAQATAAAPAA